MTKLWGFRLLYWHFVVNLQVNANEQWIACETKPFNLPWRVHVVFQWWQLQPTLEKWISSKVFLKINFFEEHRVEDPRQVTIESQQAAGRRGASEWPDFGTNLYIRWRYITFYWKQKGACDENGRVAAFKSDLIVKQCYQHRMSLKNENESYGFAFSKWKEVIDLETTRDNDQ